MTRRSLRATVLGVKNLLTARLNPNPLKPRAPANPGDLEMLKESIRRVGILVPLTVFRDARSGRYVILDGLRRWICASSLGLKSVPVNEVREPTLGQDAVSRKEK